MNTRTRDFGGVLVKALNLLSCRWENLTYPPFDSLKKEVMKQMYYQKLLGTIVKANWEASTKEKSLFKSLEGN